MMTNDEIVEMMARGEFESAHHPMTWEDALEKLALNPCAATSVNLCNCRNHARASYAALTANGMMVVPMDPTPEMVKAGIDADDMRTGAETFKHIYRAMITAKR